SLPYPTLFRSYSQSAAQTQCPLTRGGHHSVPATTRGTIKIARWHHHRASFYLLSCSDKCCIACAILRSITARRVSLAGKRFNIISHAATASPNRCCSKALYAYMLSTRILLWSVLTNWRSSSPPRRLSL